MGAGRCTIRIPMRPTLRDLFVLAWPIVVSRATQTVVGLADALMVGHLGTSALAATTTGALNAFVLMVLPMGSVFIVQSFASQLFAKGDLAGARRFAVYGLLISLVTELLSIGVIPLIDPLVSLLPDDGDDMRGLLANYLVWRLGAAGAVVGLEALGAYYGGINRTSIPMFASVFAMVANVALNYLLIDGQLGFPALGVVGAALASAISSSLAFVCLLVHFVASGPSVHGLKRSELIRTLRFGLPAGFNWFFEFMAFILFVDIVVAGLGTTVLAALNAVMQLNSVAFMPAFGVASAGAILVGQQIGRGAHDYVGGVVRMTFGVASVWMSAVGILYFVFPELLMAPFASEPGSRVELLRVGSTMLRLGACWQLFDAAGIVLAEALRAAGDTVWPLVARLVLAWFVFVPGSYVSVVVLGGAEGSAMVWFIIYLALLSLALLIRYRSGRWRALQLTEPQLDVAL